MVGEGPTERIFLQHLKDLYWCRSCDHNVKVDAANGGSPEDIVRKANVLLSQGAYDKCQIVLDTDVPWEEKDLSRQIKARNVIVLFVGSEPCIEGLMLRILEGRCPRDAKECKRQFQNKYIQDRQMRDQRKYTPLFPMDVIEKARIIIPALDRIVSFIENKPCG